MNRLEKLKKYVLLLGVNEILVVTNKDGTRDYYSFKKVEESEVLSNANKGVYSDKYKFYFIDEDEL